MTKASGSLLSTESLMGNADQPATKRLAALFIMPEAARDWDASSTTYGHSFADAMLPWGWGMPNFGDRRRQLVKGTAMALAELERIDRAAIAAQAAAKEGAHHG